MTRPERTRVRTFLADANARSDGIVERWAASNEQWWDWYLSLAWDDGSTAAPPVEVPPLPALPAPSLAALEAELDAPYPLSPGAVEAFRRDGYVKLRDVCSAPALLALRRHLEALFARTLDGAPAMRFPSLEMMWTVDPVARAFVLSRRLARLAAELLGVDAVRLYHDNALSKLPGCGRTPWHYDAHHYPIASEHVVTVWVPLQPTPRAMGPLAFARGIDTWRLVADVPFSKFDDSYDRRIAQTLRDGGVVVDDAPFELGEVSFHHTRSLHTAGPNRTDLARMALATTYLEDGARLVDSPTLISGDYEKFMPGVTPGGAIASALNPVLFDRKRSR
jgi:ectoine hydroxylase-related dioxygenase (phytanoyl-CoA dioxygenase family)